VIVTPRIAARIGLLVLAGVIAQLAFFSRISLLGASPDVSPVLVVCFGLLGGSLAGAVCGFSAGLLVDTLQYQTLGATSLALILVGYLAGRYRESFDVSGPLAAPALAGGLTWAETPSISWIVEKIRIASTVRPAASAGGASWPETSKLSR
jgi:rod shape-determining protein MreD